MAARRVLSSFAPILLLVAFTVSARNAPLEPHEPQDGQDILGFAPEATHSPSNITADNPTAESMCAAEPADGNIFDLFKRQNTVFCSLRSETTYYCDYASRCCTHSADPDGWCCPDYALCGYIQSPSGCTYPTAYTTRTWTSTSYYYLYSTTTTSEALYTDYETVTSTSTYVVTETDLQTVTEWTYVTVSAPQAGKARREASIIAPSRSTPIVSPTPITPTPTIAEVEPAKEQRLLMPEITAPAKLHARGLFRRQSVSTWTSTVWTTVTEVVTSSRDYTSTDYYTVTSETTYYVTRTSTYAPNAQETVQATSTVTEGIAVSGGDDDTVPVKKSSKLSKGAQAGIATGSAAGSLIICIILGFFWRRRKANKQAEVAGMISAAVVAAQGAQNQQPPPEKPKPVVQAAQYPTSPTPSSMVPMPVMYQHQQPQQGSGHTSPTLYQPYPFGPSPSPGAGYEMSATPAAYTSATPVAQMPATPAAQMSATPAMQYVYPRPPSPAQPGRSPPPQTPAEMHYDLPVLSEAPGVYSPRPTHGGM